MPLADAHDDARRRPPPHNRGATARRWLTPRLLMLSATPHWIKQQIVAKRHTMLRGRVDGKWTIELRCNFRNALGLLTCTH